MAFQTIPGGGYFPAEIKASNLSLATILLDAASEKAAAIIQAPKTGTISKVGFRTSTVTTGDTVDVRLETVSLTNGDPTGTLLGTNSNGSQVIDATDDNTWFTTTLTTGVAVTKGDFLAVVIVNGSVPGNLNISTWRMNDAMFPYVDHFTAAWSKIPDKVPNVALEYSDGSYAVVQGASSLSVNSIRTFNSGSTPDERGLKLKLPFPVRVTGAWGLIDTDGDLDIVLYDSDGTTVLLSLSFDKDVRQTNGLRAYIVTFSSTAELLANTFYRLVLKPTSVTDIRMRDFDVDSVSVMDSMSGGQDFHHTERTNAGSWTDTTTRRPLIGLICDAFDDSSAVGHANLNGGMQ